MKVKILTGHSKKEQERRGLLVPSTRRHPGAMGAYWADTFFSQDRVQHFINQHLNWASDTRTSTA